MSKLETKEVTINELEQLQQIGRQTFAETFSSGNNQENMRKYLEEKFSIHQLKSELSDEHSDFYFAVLDGMVAGYLKINLGPSQTEIKDEEALEIERIYVLKDFQGKKVGQFLYEKTVEIARRKKVKYVWLGVWEENLKAINFYRKNGFVEFDKHIFKFGNEEQTDIMMKLSIS